MERFPEYEVRGARPRRNVSLPARYADYEMDHRGYSSQRNREAVKTPEEEHMVRTTSLTLPYDSATPSRLQWRDAAPQELELCFGADGQRYYQGNELTSPTFPEEETRYRSPDHFTPLPLALHSRHPYEDCRAELEGIRRERHMIQQTQRHMSSELAELRTLRSEMSQLVDAVRNLKTPSPLCARNPELMVMPSQSPVGSGSYGVEEDDWPAPPPWPDPINEVLPPSYPPQQHHPNKREEELPHVKKEPMPSPTTNHIVGQPQTPYSSRYVPPTLRPLDNNACYSPPWFEPIHPPPRPDSSPTAGLKFPTAYGSPSYGIDYNTAPPQQHLSISRSRQLPTGRPQANNFLISEPSYHGPRPTIPNFSSRDPSEFARLKISLENLLPKTATELFKYQVLVDHLHLEEAKLIADAYLNSLTPFSDTMAALNDKYGQPHQIALRRIAAVLDAPDIRRGDLAAFEKFALQIQSLVGMLRTLGHEGEIELQCGSHVARLLSKLPPEQRAEFRRCMFHQGTRTHTLPDLSEWLKYESWCQDSEGQTAVRWAWEKSMSKPEGQQGKRSTTVLHGAVEEARRSAPGSSLQGNKGRPYCPFCNNEEHYLSQCIAVSKLTKEQLTEWIRSNKRCWRCARPHQAAQCNLKRTCSLCQGKHLQVLHDINVRPPKPVTTTPEGSHGTRATTEVLYLDRPREDSRVLLKVVQVRIHHGDRSLDTFAILDDGSEKTMLLPEAAEKLGVQGTPENLPLRTIRQEVQTLDGASVSFEVSSPVKPKKRFKISGAFTSPRIGLADHTYPIKQLQQKYKHLIGLPLRNLTKVKPLLLIGSDHPHLVTPVEPVRLGPPGGPAAIRTRLGWALQGPAGVVCDLTQPQQCLFTTIAPQVNKLMKNIERPWQVDTVPFRSEKLVTRSKRDQEAIAILQSKTTRVEVDGILRYATPLLRRKDMLLLQAAKEAIIPSLQTLERQPPEDPAKAESHQVEMEKLIKAGSVIKCDQSHHNSWRELVEVTMQGLHGAANSNDPLTAKGCRQAEQVILQRAQMDSFQQKYRLLKAGKPVPRNSRLLILSPELDEKEELISVGRLRRAENLEPAARTPQNIVFRYNPSAAPHFGGVWERKKRSVKGTLFATQRSAYGAAQWFPTSSSLFSERAP